MPYCRVTVSTRGPAVPGHRERVSPNPILKEKDVQRLVISDQSHHLLLLPWRGTSQGMLKNGKAESPIFLTGGRWRNTSYISFICKTCHFYLENIPQIYPPLSTSATSLLGQNPFLSHWDYCNSGFHCLKFRGEDEWGPVESPSLSEAFMTECFTMN